MAVVCPLVVEKVHCVGAEESSGFVTFRTHLGVFCLALEFCITMISVAISQRVSDGPLFDGGWKQGETE